MIIPNGYILFRTSASIGADSNGYPRPAAEAWSEPVECQYLPANNLRARSQGEAHTAHSYTIYVDAMTVPSEVIKLCDERGEIGQFSIRSHRQLEAVCQTEIIV